MKPHKILNFSEKGMTLVEIMITTAIIGIIGSIGALLLLHNSRLWLLNRARVEVQQKARTSITIINKNIRQAQASSIVIDRYSSSQPPYSRITFTTASGNTLSYYQNGTKLYMDVNGTATMLSDKLRVLSFAYPRTDNDDIINVSVTMEESTYEGGSKALQLSIEKVRIMN